MIISASRRTDIPSYYSEWFVNRLKAGEVLVPNPYNRKKISRIPLSPDTVDCIAFWTKNPEPMIPRLKEIERLGYQYYFQMSVTAYGKALEENVPSVEESIATFVLLSERLGKERVDWRFDPIILNKDYTCAWHMEQFEMMCDWLHKYTTRCIISFVDNYKDNTFTESEQEEMMEAAEGISKIAGKYGLSMFTCAEKINLEKYGIRHGACIDKEKIRQVIGYKLDLRKDPGQRRECGCVESIDVGMYDTCVNGCRYCYATGSLESAQRKNGQHDPKSPLLIGHLKGDETIVDRRVQSSRDVQMSLFDYPFGIQTSEYK